MADDDIEVVLPDGRIGQFPKEMKREEIEAVLQKQFPPEKAAASAGAEKRSSAWEALNKPLGKDVQTQVREKVSDVASRLPEGLREPAAYAGHLLTAIPASIAEAGRRMTTSPLGVATAGAGGYMQALRELPQIPRAAKAAATLAELGTGAAFGYGGAKEALTPRQEGETGLQEFERRVGGAGQALMGAAPVLHAAAGFRGAPARTLPETPRVIPPEGRIGPGMRTRIPRLPEPERPGAPPAEPPPEAPPPVAPPTAGSQLDVVARRMFGRPYDLLSSEDKVVVARNVGGPEVERRVLRGEAPGVMERRAENMPLPTRAPEAGGQEIARPGQPNAEPATSGTLPRTTGPPAAPPPQTLTPPKTLSEAVDQATGNRPPSPQPGIPLNEQLRRTQTAPVTTPEDPLKAEFPDPKIRQFARANGAELVRAAGDRPEVLQAVHDMTNVDVRQAAINFGIDVGQKHVGSRMLMGEGQVSRQDLIDQMIRQGAKPENIPGMAKPQTQTIPAGQLKVGDTFVDESGEPRRVAEITKSGKIKTADGTLRNYQGQILARGALNSPTAQLARGGRFHPEGEREEDETVRATTANPKGSKLGPRGSTMGLFEKPAAVGEKPTVADFVEAMRKRNKAAGLKPIIAADQPEAALGRALKIGEAELDFQRMRPNSGEEWYNQDAKRYDNALQKYHDAMRDPAKLTIAKAIQAGMSLGNKSIPAVTNTLDAIDAWQKTGKIPLKNPATGGAWPNGQYNVYMHGFRRLQILINEKGEAGAGQWLMEQHPVSELRKYSPGVKGSATDMQYGALVLGPKFGPFFLNNMGIAEALTTDMWWARTWNRWMGTPFQNILKDGKRIQKVVEQVRPGAERSVMEDFARTLAQKKNLEVKQVQAILWNYEQALYKLHGFQNAEQPSYGQAAETIVGERLRQRDAQSGAGAPRTRQDAGTRRSARSVRRSP